MPRKGENIYKRKDGRWEGRYIKERTSNKTCYGYIYGKTYKDVKTKLILAKSEWKSKQNILILQKERENILFSEIAKLWLESSAATLKESTVAKYRNLLSHYILPVLGKYFLSEITNDMIYTFGYELLKSGGKNGNGLSPKTVSDSLSVLKSIQNYAIARNIDINFSVCHFQMKQSQKVLRVFSLSEQQRLYQYLKVNQTFSNLGILLCLFTGIRVGELCALKWEDISVTEKTLYIHQTMQRLQIRENAATKTMIVISKPKSACSIRTIPIPEIIIEDILKMQQDGKMYFLTGDREKYIEPRTMQNRFKAILRKCGIEDANFHTLRHTFATRCVEVGFDIKSLSEILGHSNVNITLNRYVHPTLELKQKNMAKLSDLFSVK